MGVRDIKVRQDARCARTYFLQHSPFLSSAYC